MLKRNWLLVLVYMVVAFVVTEGAITTFKERNKQKKSFDAYMASEPVDTVWRGASQEQIPYYTDSGKLIWYGHELIANTSYYLGPKGTVAQTTNGMNCQNCHLDGGTLPYGNNFGKVYSTYPQFRARNNGIQSIYARVNDCFERSLNGQSLDSNTHEMQAIYAYIKWLGDDVPKGDAEGGTSLMKVKYLKVAANASLGEEVYVANCQSCHGDKGQGVANTAGTGYTYPPLWGEHSYNDGAGLFRLSSFAGFVKNNMPFGTTYHNPKLSDADAWNVAAFVNSQPRPHKDQSAEWKNITKKPVDFPFGPYIDSFSEAQHKYGPYQPINEYAKTIKALDKNNKN